MNIGFNSNFFKKINFKFSDINKLKTNRTICYRL